ncbi:MAG: PQQ-binding-like beta-propeller repeat protein [Planctomycetes bacterium]|nr:PQQ-binding-like beta-propeller repeat protein [Planctomycetota bacterium]
MRQSFAILLIVLTASLATGEEYWNQFRGSRGNGQSASASLPINWSETENVAWKTAIDGKAWSSPVVWGDQIWMTNATPDGKRLSAVCVDGSSGKIIRDVTVFEIAEPMFCIDYNSYASPTPVIEEGRLWVHYGSAGTACLDTATGEITWSRQDLPCDHLRAAGSSPIIFRDLLYLTFDGADYQYIAALDKKTGKTVWKTDRTIDYGTDNGDLKKAYSTPTVFEHAGRLQLLSPASVASESYDPLTGELLWTVYHGGFNAAARPLYSHGKVFINLQRGLCLLAVRPDGRGDVTKTHIEWDTKHSTPTRPSQLIIGDHLYMVNDKGIVSCVDIKTGKASWTERMGSSHSGSPIASDGRIYFVAEDGKMRVIAADPKEFRILAENQLDGGCMASPGAIENALVVRTKTHLYRIEN